MLLQGCVYKHTLVMILKRGRNVLRNMVKEFFNKFEEIVTSMALSITILAVLINTLSGWIIGKRYGQLEEIAITGFVWVTFLGISVVYKNGAHIRIDFIVEAFPKKIKNIVQIIVDITVILFSIFVAYNASVLMMGAIEKTTSLLHISYFFIDLPVVLGFSFMTIRTIIQMTKDFKQLRTPKNKKEEMI